MVEHRKRLHSIDESISQGSGKIQKMLNEGFSGTKSSLAALEVNSNTQYNSTSTLSRYIVYLQTNFP